MKTTAAGKTFKASEILETNKHVVINNWINDYMWYGRDIKHSIRHTQEHERLCTYNCVSIECDISIEVFMMELVEYLKSLNDYKEFLKHFASFKRYTDAKTLMDVFKNEHFDDTYSNIVDVYNTYLKIINQL